MNTNEEVADYLTKPDNLEFALELVGHLEDLKNKLHPKFWEIFNLKMENMLNDSEYSSTWNYHKIQAAKFKTKWEKVFLTPSDADHSILRMAFGQAYKGIGFRLFWGVRWNKPPENIPNNITGKLDSALLDMDITIEEKPTWIRWGYTPFTIYSAEFLRRMHVESEEFVVEVCDKFWELFLKLRPMMEEVNHQIRG